MPKDNSNQGSYLMSQWLSGFRASFGLETANRINSRFGQSNFRKPLRLDFAFPTEKAPDLRNNAPGPGRKIAYVNMPS